MRKRFACMVFAVCAAVCVMLGGCGEKKPAEPSDDTPWNNGHYAIMETDNGYYANLKIQTLRFYEKGTDTEIYLCGKPECPHDGRESCTATYQNMQMVNTVLYDGMLYILAIQGNEDKVSYELYRAAPDGSTLDKVGEAALVEKFSGNHLYVYPNSSMGMPSAFIIHRGYAYIPYYFELAEDLSSTLLGGGIVKMDLQTGKTEPVYTMKLMGDRYPVDLAACGDYLYFSYYKGYAKSSMFYRYDIRDGSLVNMEKEYFKNHEDVEAVTEKKLYISKWDEEGKKVYAYDSETMEETEEVFTIDTELSPRGSRLVPYRDQLLVYYGDRVAIYSEEGEKLGELLYDFPEFLMEHPTYSYEECNFFIRISDEKVYAVLWYDYEFYHYVEDVELGPELDREKHSEVYACPISDILEGKGAWEHIYTVRYREGGMPYDTSGGKTYYGGIRNYSGAR